MPTITSYTTKCDLTVSRVSPLSGHRWLVQRTAARELVVVDGRLAPIWRVRLPAGRLGSAVVVEDLSLVALPRDGQVVLLDEARRQLAGLAGSSSDKTNSGRRCAVFTGDGTYLWAILPQAPIPRRRKRRAACCSLFWPNAGSMVSGRLA